MTVANWVKSKSALISHCNGDEIKTVFISCQWFRRCAGSENGDC